MRLLLHSGGLDSHIIWLMDRTRVPVYIDHGQANAAHEKRALAALCLHHQQDAVPFKVQVTTMPSLKLLVQRDGHIPHRNLAFCLHVAMAYPQARAIAYGALRGEASADKSPAFVRAATHVLTESEGERMRIEAPLLHTTKPAAVRMVAKQHPEWLPALALTRSCYSHELRPCGVCQACFRRGLAYWYAGLQERPPAMPTQTDGPVANLLRTPLHRWPALLAANLPVLKGLLHR